MMRKPSCLSLLCRKSPLSRVGTSRHSRKSLQVAPLPSSSGESRLQGEIALPVRGSAMCGIAGMIDWRAATSADALRSIGEAMIETVRHRGPDAGAVWVEAESGAALGQRRLAIIDLSPGGAQPMHSADPRHVITFNGEIYNYRDIRRAPQAASPPLRAESATKV